VPARVHAPRHHFGRPGCPVLSRRGTVVADAAA
jgi:hypothetical protein